MLCPLVPEAVLLTSDTKIDVSGQLLESKKVQTDCSITKKLQLRLTSKKAGAAGLKAADLIR